VAHHALAANGSPVQELRRWRFNVVTNYDFRGERLKGFSIGGAARWQDRVAIGFPAMRNAAGATQTLGQCFKPRRRSRHQHQLRPAHRQRFGQSLPNT
jgi:hypothetical protein